MLWHWCGAARVVDIAMELHLYKHMLAAFKLTGIYHVYSYHVLWHAALSIAL